MLEQQQRWLVNALQELYQRIIDGNGWPGTCLKPEPNGHPLTHDILVRLGTLDHSQVKCCEENLKPVQRKKSSESSSEITHSPISPPYICPEAFSSPKQQCQDINVYNLLDSTNTMTTASYPTFNIDTALLSPMFNRPLPINSVPFGGCDYFDQLFDPNPAEISLISRSNSHSSLS